MLLGGIAAKTTTSYVSLLSQGATAGGGVPPIRPAPASNNYPASTKNSSKPSGNNNVNNHSGMGNRFMNITADDVGELEGNIHTSRNASFVVNLL